MKTIFRNTDLPIHLSWGGILLIALRPFLSANDIVEKDSALSMTLFFIGIAAIVSGGLLRLYQQKQAGQPYLRNFVSGIAIGLAITAIMMMTGIIHTPSFILEWFQ